MLHKDSCILLVDQQVATTFLSRDDATLAASEVPSTFAKLMIGNRWFLCVNQYSTLGNCIVGSVKLVASGEGDHHILCASDPHTYACPVVCTIASRKGRPCISTDSREDWSDLQRAAEGRGPKALRDAKMAFSLTCTGFSSDDDDDDCGSVGSFVSWESDSAQDNGGTDGGEAGNGGGGQWHRIQLWRRSLVDGGGVEGGDSGGSEGGEGGDDGNSVDGGEDLDLSLSIPSHLSDLYFSLGGPALWPESAKRAAASAIERAAAKEAKIHPSRSNHPVPSIPFHPSRSIHPISSPRRSSVHVGVAGPSASKRRHDSLLAAAASSAPSKMAPAAEAAAGRDRRTRQWMLLSRVPGHCLVVGERVQVNASSNPKSHPLLTPMPHPIYTLSHPCPTP